MLELLQGPKRVSDLKGVEVRSAHGGSLGKISDFMLSHEGCIKYAIVSYGGFLGVGERLMPVPWTMFKAEPGGFVIDIEKARFDEAPYFESERWPHMGTADWEAQIDRYYETVAAGGDLSEFAKYRRRDVEAEMDTKEDNMML
jgi:sporulation protein YlmC with PRC-barrel domain